ncbi:MAG: DUF2062 domain-containing protein [Fuerstiella sp.]
MLRRVLKLSTSPQVLLRSVLALDDSPHSIALGVSIGIFVGLTPSVGIQTVLILAVVFLTRPFFYFNGTAAMASTYISNPLTMAPLYYFWYRLGAWFFPGYSKTVDLSPLTTAQGLSGWWNATCELAMQVGWPMLTGAMMTAPVGAAIAYPLTRMLVGWFRHSGESMPPGAAVSGIGQSTSDSGGSAETDDDAASAESSDQHKPNGEAAHDDGAPAASLRNVALAR